MVISFLGVWSKSKHFGENKDKLSYCKNFWCDILILRIFYNCQSPYCLKLVIINFYLSHIFQYIPLKMLLTIFASRKNRSLLSTKWVTPTPKITHFLVLAPGGNIDTVKPQQIKLSCPDIRLTFNVAKISMSIFPLMVYIYIHISMSIFPLMVYIYTYIYIYIYITSLASRNTNS